MAKVEKESGVLEYLFKPKFSGITMHPAQESTSIRDAEKDTQDLASRLTACACLGVVRAVLDPENKLPIAGYLLGTVMVLTAVDLGISWAKLIIAQRNFKKDYARLHSGK